LFG
jgi:ATP-dependent RNA helicase DDX27